MLSRLVSSLDRDERKLSNIFHDFKGRLPDGMLYLPSRTLLGVWRSRPLVTLSRACPELAEGKGEGKGPSYVRAAPPRPPQGAVLGCGWLSILG